MRRTLTIYALRALEWARNKLLNIKTAPDPRAELRGLRVVVEALQRRLSDSEPFDWLPQNLERAAELAEARQMVQAPWLVSEARPAFQDPTSDPATLSKALREADPIGSQGATGDINLMLQTVNWKREVNLSWLEFSRWGIQQLILVSRLYWMKNPIPRRLVDVCAAYVFARGVEVITGDEDANAVLKDFFQRNKNVLGKVALVKAERQKDTDGNLFFAFFSDKTDKGEVTVRSIDALEVMDIVTDPQDNDTPWYYLRIWTERGFDPMQGIQIVQRMAWHPALNYNPPDEERALKIRGIDVRWDVPVYHRKCGDIGKWLFGCPRIYPMLDWASEAKKFLTACAAIRQALSQFSMTVTTKGGQQALDAIKQQVMTTVGPSANLFDSNPPAIAGSIFGSGPGTKIEAFKTAGAGFDPEGVRQYKLMCCMVKGVPETFLGDVSTGNLATATTLDRPTETFMLSLQEEWVYDLEVISSYVLGVSKRAPSGRLQEGLRKRGLGTDQVAAVKILECEKVRTPSGGWRYKTLAPTVKTAEAGMEATDETGEIRIQVNFPSIREGDMKTIVEAAVNAGTLGNKAGQVVGIDVKALVKYLYRALDVEDGDELAEMQYPDGEYDPDRTTEVIAPPIGKAQPQPAGPQPTPAQAAAIAAAADDPETKAAKEALKHGARRVIAAFRRLEAEEAARGTSQGAVV